MSTRKASAKKARTAPLVLRIRGWLHSAVAVIPFTGSATAVMTSLAVLLGARRDAFGWQRSTLANHRTR